MKNKSIIRLVLMLMGFGFMASSCEDMLSPDLERYAEKSGQDTVYSYLGILKSMQNIAERYVILGESRGDLVTTDIYTSDSISHIANFDDPADGDSRLLRVADFYKVINECNFYLAYADTALIKNNEYYMRKEYAQVQAMRAWTYLQLVQNYGEVPFVTRPIGNTSLGQDLEKNAPRANRSNLVDLLLEAGLGRAETLQDQYGYPGYGTYRNGSTNIPSTSCFIPVSLVMADLYLLKDDYENAAAKYYKFIRDEAPVVPSTSAKVSRVETGSGISYNPVTTSWIGRFRNYTKNSSNDLVTLLPGAANQSFGTMLTAVQNVYGFETTSSNSTTSNKDDDETTDGEEVVTSSGSIRVSPNEKYIQLTPSANYVGLNNSQVYCFYSENASGDAISEYWESGDPRGFGAAPNNRIDGVYYRFISKFAPYSSISMGLNTTIASSFSIFYGVQIYRKALVHLRFAEAINRAGYPQHAFAILKDGLSYENLPILDYQDTLRYNLSENPRLDKETGEPILDESGALVYDTVSVDTFRNVPYLQQPLAETGGASYISLAEMLRAAGKPYLNFLTSEFDNQNVWGIHSLGCGDNRGSHDTLYDYDRCVAEKIAKAEAEAGGHDAEWTTARRDALVALGIDQAVAEGEITTADVIEAVEDLIIDELALETAFEGNRYYDLMRFASHKGNGAIDNEWLAKRIARRGYAPGQADYDLNLYNKLSTGNHWFLSLPQK